MIWLSTQGSPPANPMTGTATLTPEQAQQFSAGEWYVNVHTQSHPAGRDPRSGDPSQELTDLQRG